MAGLPKLPGYNFVDPTLSRYHLSHTFDYINGYRLPKIGMPAAGGRELDSNSVAYIQSNDPVRYDPSLTYGRTRSVALPQYMPHYALYDQKCLTFRAFFKQSVVESATEYYRVRIVNIIYFLEDDTITVMEPRIQNSGLDQGRLVRRGKIPKTDMDDYWHWKDLNVGKDIALYGIVYHTVDCDTFTKDLFKKAKNNNVIITTAKSTSDLNEPEAASEHTLVPEFMRSQGLIMAEAEEMPPDPYTQLRQLQVQAHETTTPSADDKLRRFLEYDGKVLKFDAVWDTRGEEFGELRPYQVLYFLSDDTISVKEVIDKNSGRDPFPLMLKKTKLPKVYTDRPVNYASIYLELSDAEVTEFYQPKDMLVGQTIFVLGRPILLVDCDKFTRDYFRKALCIDQKPAIEYKEKPKPQPPKPMPPHDGLGSLEDSLQNTITCLPKPPRKDVIRQLLNANKYLRYIMKFDVVHPEDEIRRFILKYSLSNGTCYIHEPPIRNSGIWGGRYLRDSLISKPGTDPLNPEYYTPADFYIGAVIIIHSQRFIIIDADLYVYRYMQANPEKFPSHVMENMRNFMFNKGYLNDDVEAQLENEIQEQKKAHRDAIGKELEYTQTEMEKCLIELKAGGGGDPEYEKRKRAALVQEYEDSLKPTYVVPEHGIMPVNLECAYPVVIGKIPDTTCKEDDVGPTAYTPKHIDTPEEIEHKYYANVLKQHHDVCEHGKPVVCEKAELVTRVPPDKIETESYQPIMVSGVEHPKTACRVKNVHFAEGDEKCNKDRYDLCGLKKNKVICDCTPYQKKC